MEPTSVPSVAHARAPRTAMPEGLRERVGARVGRWWAPAIARVSHARHGRMFHPEGHTFVGHAAAVPGPFEVLGGRLTGRVLARFSGALWRDEREHLEVLGCALRFRRGPGIALDHRAEPGDTDLLAATIRSPLTMLLAPLFTDAHDFTTNRYWAVSPFAHDELGRFELRLSPVERLALHGPRAARLYHAVEWGRAAWWLEARHTLHLRWHRLLCITLAHHVAIDQEALRFDPFRGVLRPVGLVHAIRRAAYAASQDARPPATAL